MSYKSEVNFARGFIRHINPLMFGVINDKPERFIMYKHEPVGRGFIYTITSTMSGLICYKSEGNFAN